MSAKAFVMPSQHSLNLQNLIKMGNGLQTHSRHDLNDLKNKKVTNQKFQTLSAHFNELKNRVLFCAIFFLLSFAICYYFSDKIYEFLLEPLAQVSSQNANRRIIYTSPSEAFFTYLRLSLNSALFFSLPIFITQIYLFLAPGLYKKEKKIILNILIFAPLLFLFGALIAYYFILPIAFDFFLSFENTSTTLPIQLEARVSEYLQLVMHLLFGFGIAFETPLILILLVKIGLLSVEKLRKTRRYWIVFIFIISAILTPPDVLSQAIMAGILLVLFEMVIIICSLSR